MIALQLCITVEQYGQCQKVTILNLNQINQLDIRFQNISSLPEVDAGSSAYSYGITPIQDSERSEISRN
jgi:hypothetical protein